MARTQKAETNDDANEIVELSDNTDSLSLDKMAVEAVTKTKPKSVKTVSLKDESSNHKVFKVVPESEYDERNVKTRTIVAPVNETPAYFSYASRLTIKILLFGIFFVLGVYFLINSVSLKNEKIINYSESSNLGYEVCLKEMNSMKANA